MEWMRFDPVKFGLLVDGESFEVEGAFARIIRHLWNRGPLPEAEVRRILKGNFEVVRMAMFEVDGNLSLELVEDARAHGQRRINQRVEAGIASAAKRNDRSTKMNDRSTDVLSMSLSSSESTQEKKERASAKSEGFEEFWSVYPSRKAKGHALKAWEKLTASERPLCLPAIQAQVKAHHFRGRDGQDFTPHPATWLNARRWEDEITERADDPKRPMTKEEAREIINKLREQHGRDFQTHHIPKHVYNAFYGRPAA